MPTITIPEETYRRLAVRATALGTTPDALALPALERAADESVPGGPPPELPADMPHADRNRAFDAWMAAVEARADEYPPATSPT